MTENSEQTLQAKIIAQVEYYFGDVNLARDNFLKDQLGKEDGWVALDTLLTFNRLKALTTDKNLIAESIAQSTSGLLQLSEDKEKVKRLTPMPEFDEQYRHTLKLRSVHLRGFPKDSTLEQIQDFCNKYGTVESVQMRRLNDETKSFKGCIFVIYKNETDAQNAVNGTEKFLDEHELQRENKQDYFKRKAAFKVKKDKKLANLKNGDVSASNEQSQKEFTFEKGCVLKLHDIKETINFMDIKKAFLEHSKVEYVEMFADKSEALVRFASPSDLITATEKLKSVDENREAGEENSKPAEPSESIELNIVGKKINSEVLCGEAEDEYWKVVAKIKSQYCQKPRSKGNFKGKNKRKRGYEGGGNKRNKVAV